MDDRNLEIHTLRAELTDLRKRYEIAIEQLLNFRENNSKLITRLIYAEMNNKPIEKIEKNRRNMRP